MGMTERMNSTGKNSNTQNELTNISLCIEMAQAPQHAIYKQQSITELFWKNEKECGKDENFPPNPIASAQSE